MIAVTLNLGDTPVISDHMHRTEAQMLVSMLRETAVEFFTIDAAAIASNVADQIEAQLPKPKPAEPTGLGAVVEDADGKLWTLVGSTGCWVPAGLGLAGRVWSELDVVRVLSEGVVA